MNLSALPGSELRPAPGTMLEVPTLRAGPWRGVTVEIVELAGNRLAAVTVRRVSQATFRRWFGDELAALAYAVEQADALTLPLFDLRDPAGD